MCVIDALTPEFDVKVISFKRLYPQWLYPGESDRTAPLPRDDSRFQLDLLNPLSWLQTLRSIAQHQPIAVIVPWWTTVWALPFGWLFRRLRARNIQPIGLIHNVLPHEANRSDTWLTRWALQPVEKFIVQAQSEYDRLGALLPNVAIETCAHPPYATLAPVEQPRQTDVPELLFFGLIRAYKGLADLLDALAIVKQQGLTFQLNVVGECWEDIATYHAQIERLDLTDYVTIDARFVPDDIVHVAFQRASVVVAPYRHGTQSSVLALAQGYGKPIIASSVIEDTLAADYAGWQRIVPPNNPALLAQAIMDALTECPTDVTVAAPSWTCFVDAVNALLQR